MRQSWRYSAVLVVPALIGTLALAGCAKRPATAAASAPAPTGATASAPSNAPTSRVAPAASRPASTAPGSSSSSSRSDGAVATARPAAKDFVETDKLKDIHFDFDKYNIRPADTKVLDENAKWLKANPGNLLMIEGHADERGTNEYNLALGERRAKSTMNYLVGQGVQAQRITVTSYGEERPVCTQHNEECWAKNRRAHFLVKPQ